MVGWGQRPGVLLTVLGLALPAEGAAGQNGLSMYGDPKYQQGFPHFDYVNPGAPKGGSVTLSALGGFDTLNPFTIRGVPAAGLGDTAGNHDASCASEARLPGGWDQSFARLEAHGGTAVHHPPRKARSTGLTGRPCFEVSGVLSETDRSDQIALRTTPSGITPAVA